MPPIRQNGPTPRAYTNLAARPRIETAARRVSATDRMTAESPLDGNRIELVGKGDKAQEFTISPHLHRMLFLYLAAIPGPLAPLRGYQSAYARAMAVK